MLIVVALIALAAALTALSRVRSLTGEVQGLRQELEALREAQGAFPAPAVTALPLEEEQVTAPTASESAPPAAITDDAPADTPPQTPPGIATAEGDIARLPSRLRPTDAEIGDLIFAGIGAPAATSSANVAADQEAVERAARGEPLRRSEAAALDAPQPRATATLESTLGARWAVWVGGFALALGGIFMVKYSIDAGLLSPAVRLTLAALFGLVLMAAGEIVRRRAVPAIASEYENAMIPGILTAAGAVTLFAVAYAAYGMYGFIGPGTTFAALAAVSFLTLALSLLHGQALAGLGLVAAMATPLLVTSEHPSAAILFSYLSVTLVAALAASRLRRWTVAPAIANLGMGLWALFYLAVAEPVDPLLVSLPLLLVVAAMAFLWPGAAAEEDIPEAASSTGRARTRSAGERLFAPAFAAVTITATLAVLLPALFIAGLAEAGGFDAGEWLARSGAALAAFAALTTALAMAGALRPGLAPAAPAALVAAIGGMTVLTSAGLLQIVMAALFDTIPGVVLALGPAPKVVISTGMALSVVFLFIGALVQRRFAGSRPDFATLWAVLMALAPAIVTTLTFVAVGAFAVDWTHGLFALAAAAVLVAVAELRSRIGGKGTDTAVFWLIAGSAYLVILALHALTDGLATTLGLALAGALFVAGTRLRAWRALPWAMVAATLSVAVRIAIEPTIVGPEHLSTTPVFNPLLAGYGIPALLLMLAAFELRRWPDLRAMQVIQALASLFVLLTIAILVRHALSGGVLDSRAPTLGEQSIYTLLAIGASAVFLRLDLKAPSPVFRIGGMLVGVLSMLGVLSAHLFALNPYFTGERLGSLPVLDLLFIGYLLPAAGYVFLAREARGRRPQPYVAALAVTGGVLAFTWATLTVRRFWQGETIADWKGILEGEMYTYSLVWLLLGVLLLLAGIKWRSRAVRIASAVLVFLSVAKVFLFDMAQLEGFLRALSFIGLGVVLIGIGLFYQRILSRMSDEQPAALPADSAEEQKNADA
ncbi:Uncharacterized membrane protein [Rhizobium sp. RU20A]|uniref:DUF2339 domain-containing protein n=1 Tax=Rhizobium sp. RU20A TaxID=1907412 RepID=UPI000954FF0F|nr:DUF2339 domain-containing protein [Rhizobium sp. RU20A]SIP92069.1 Uncharacterized membrane protein [Rhizobium sp. RU20A]